MKEHKPAAVEPFNHSQNDFLSNSAWSGLMPKSTSLTLITRRDFLKSLGLAAKSIQSGAFITTIQSSSIDRLQAARYSQVCLLPGLAKQQLDSSVKTLKSISNDSLLKPIRQLTGHRLAERGVELKGWYAFNPKYDWRGGSPDGFAPAHAFGQWLSAMARAFANSQDVELKEKIAALVSGFGDTISGAFFLDARFPAYTYDKFVIGLLDAYRYAQCWQARDVLDKTTDAAEPYLPKNAVDRLVEVSGRDASYTWDESYTLPENLFLTYENGFGDRYLQLAKRFMLDETFFEPLSRGQNALIGKHAYSYMNALSSAAQAFRTTNEEKYLLAALNAFELIQNGQSYATGGWGPDELFQDPNTDFLSQSLEKSHHSFETPCGAYAHLKLMNHLLCITGDGRFGDSAEQILYNTVLGAKPLQEDGHAFYYSDYNNEGCRTYSEHVFPCCAGTLPQVATDYAKHAYFLDKEGVLVNLYINSELSFERNQTKVTLRQKHSYPDNDFVAIDLQQSNDAIYAVRLRLPHWCKIEDVKISINGKPQSISHALGFLTIVRLWSDGDKIELVLPQTLRIAPISARQPKIVALMHGPRVLFVLNKITRMITADELLSATRTSDQNRWRCTTAAGEVSQFAPFTAIDNESYQTYIKLS